MYTDYFFNKFQYVSELNNIIMSGTSIIKKTKKYHLGNIEHIIKYIFKNKFTIEYFQDKPDLFLKPFYIDFYLGKHTIGLLIQKDYNYMTIDIYYSCDIIDIINEMKSTYCVKPSRTRINLKNRLDPKDKMDIRDLKKNDIHRYSTKSELTHTEIKYVSIWATNIFITLISCPDIDKKNKKKYSIFQKDNIDIDQVKDYYITGGFSKEKILHVPFEYINIKYIPIRLKKRRNNDNK